MKRVSVLAATLMFAATAGVLGASPASAEPAAEGQALLATRVYSTVNGLNIRTGPGTGYTSVGQMQAGQSLPCPSSGCTLVTGGLYNQCGGDSRFWDKVIYGGVTRYVASRCTTWR
ncbi:SH3 domain-containing protein [Longispora albida]|uniref:SH3 domain-containing protein n=1 Tax=Longispora albida TaxID=203523 RepID=UPI0003A4288F|nr:hypothetical protein [Longispora albida]